MQISDEVPLKKIKELFMQEVRDDNYSTMSDELSRLYSELSFTRPYTIQELFPRAHADYVESKESVSQAKMLGFRARQKRKSSLNEGEDYVSCRELFREKTGIDVGREYTYPNGMSPRQFQESFSPTRLTDEISAAHVEMAHAAVYAALSGENDVTPVDIYDKAFACKLFLEKEKPESSALLKQAYNQFWKANSNISGYENLKNIQNYDDMKDFLMGVASEIPLDDIAGFFNRSHDGKIAEEIATNNFRLKEKFKIEGNPGLEMTDKTWNRFVQPVIDSKAFSEKIAQQRRRWTETR